MRILFVSTNPCVPDRIGGGELDIHMLASELRARGCECEVVAAVPPGARLLQQRVWRWVTRGRWIGRADRRNGYTTFRAWHWLVTELARRRVTGFRPDLIVMQYERGYHPVREMLQSGVPVLLRFIDTVFLQTNEPAPRDAGLVVTANSHFIASRVKDHMGVDAAVIYPMVQRDRYRADVRNPEYVTFINPIPFKGLRTAVAVARLLPHRKFLFVESWRLKRLADFRSHWKDLPNVEFQRASHEMRAVYARTAVLMAPSEYEEGFGRVALEAHINGIPVVASRKGALPEVVGEGGYVHGEAATAADWAESIERILSDQAEAGRLSALAQQNSARPEFSQSEVVEQFFRVAQAHVRAAECRSADAARGVA